MAAAVAVLDAALAGAGASRARWVTKPLVVPAIAAATPGRPPAPALAASWAGDVALLSRSDAGLLGGIGAFAIAHAAYLAAIRRHRPAPPAPPAPAGSAPAAPGGSAPPAPGGSAPAAPGTGAARRVAGAVGVEGAVAGAVWAGAGHVLWRQLDTDEERRLRVPVLGYAALVTAMGAAAVRTGRRTSNPALAAGGTLFVISDGLVAASLFGPKRKAVDAAVMLTYAAAQALLARALAE